MSKRQLKKIILIKLIALATIIGAIAFTPRCGGDGGYLIFSVPVGLGVLFAKPTTLLGEDYLEESRKDKRL